MTLIEITLCLAFAIIVAMASLALITPAWQTTHELQKMEQQATALAGIRALLSKTVEQADHVALFAHATDARAMNTQNQALSGSYLGMAFADDLYSTLEYHSEQQQLWYRHASGSEWVVNAKMETCQFVLEQGMLRMVFTLRGIPWEIWAIAN